MNKKGMFIMCLGLLMMLLAGSVVYFGKSYFEYKLPVDGNDVMKALNIEPGKKVKEALDMLLQEAFKNHDLTKEDCIQLIQDDLSLYF